MSAVPFVMGSMCVRVSASGNAQLARLSCRDEAGGGLLWRDRIVVERADVPDLIACLQGFVDDQRKSDGERLVEWPKDVLMAAQRQRVPTSGLASGVALATAGLPATRAGALSTMAELARAAEPSPQLAVWEVGFDAGLRLVVASSAKVAIDLVLAAHPNARIWSLKQLGDVEFHEES